MGKEQLDKSMTDVVAHEFFHIVTPLGVHSEDIHYFDYNNPTFSKHLWMYEGTTEYFANLFQINQGLIDAPDFYNRIMDKVSQAQRFDDTMSFTQMSAGIVEEPYQANYGNVYQKGALIGHNLRGYLGDSLFFNGVKQLLSQNKYGNLNANQFRDQLTAITGYNLNSFFDEGDEIVGYSSADDLIDKIRFYLSDEQERERIARNAYSRVMKDYRIGSLLHRAGAIIQEVSQ